MDQNNDGPEQLWTFWDFFLLWTFFWSDICVGVFLYLSRILTTACVGRKLGMGGFFF